MKFNVKHSLLAGVALAALVGVKGSDMVRGNLQFLHDILTVRPFIGTNCGKSVRSSLSSSTH
jgi:hypothetical protein